MKAILISVMMLFALQSKASVTVEANNPTVKYIDLKLNNK